MSTAVVTPPKQPTHTDVLIRASAGTGKTFQLTSRYLSLFLSGIPVDRILATTFTRKAAGEILERVLLRMALAVQDNAKRAELAHASGHPGLDRNQCRAALVELVRQLHRVRIGTLDSFFAQIAKSHTLELGLPPGWEIVDELHDAQLVSRSVESVLRDGTTGDTIRMMHLLSKGTVNRAVGDLLRTAVRSFYGLFEESDEEAWHRFPEQRFPSLDEIEGLLLELETVELPNHKTWRGARSKDLESAANEEWEAIIGRGIAGKILAGEETYCSKPIEGRVLEVYRRLISVVRAHVVESIRLQTGATHELLLRFDRVFRELKQLERVLRFQDVTTELAKATGLVDAVRLSYRLDTHLDHVLLDEFQDTSIRQWEVLRSFAANVAGPRTDRSFFCVGDTKQAIYGWRGGVAEVFDALEDEFPEVHRRQLNESYRSAPVVIETVNRVFENIATASGLGELEPAVREWCHRFEPHSTVRTGEEGYVRLVEAPEPEEGHSELQAMVRAAADEVEDIARRAPGRTVGVLTRRRVVVGWIVFELRRRGIAASEEGGNPLTDSAAVQLLLSLLRLADHPAGTAPRYHVATSPLGPALGFTDHTDDAAALKLAEGIRRSLVEHGYGPVVFDWARRIVPFCGPRDAERLGLLVRLAHGYQSEATLRARDFTRFVENEKVSTPSRCNVRVMTIHQSKGLQFDAVVLPELSFELNSGRDSFVVGRPTPTSPPERICLYRNAAVQRLLPPEWQRVFAENAGRRARESLCLLYVALTRAARELRMIVPSSTSGRNLRKAVGALLRHALGQTAEASDRVLFEAGNPNWADAAPAAVATRESEPIELRIDLAPMPDGRTRGRERIAPSHADRARRVKLHDLLQRGNATAMERGTLIHAWFECIGWLEDGAPDDATLDRIGRELGAPAELVRSARPAFREMLRQSDIAWALSRKSYEPPRDLVLPDELVSRLGRDDIRLEVHNERRFAVRDGRAIVSGSIDRLVLMYDGTTLLAADVLDFKTDAISPGDEVALGSRLDYHRTQMTTYRPAVSRMYRLPEERVSTRLVMLSPGVVRPI